MPELPEVETVRIGLQRLLPDKQITSATSDWPKSFPNAPADVQNFLIAARVVAVKRRAKGAFNRIVEQIFIGYSFKNDRTTRVSKFK